MNYRYYILLYDIMNIYEPFPTFTVPTAPHHPQLQPLRLLGRRGGTGAPLGGKPSSAPRRWRWRPTACSPDLGGPGDLAGPGSGAPVGGWFLPEDTPRWASLDGFLKAEWDGSTLRCIDMLKHNEAHWFQRSPIRGDVRHELLEHMKKSGRHMDSAPWHY